MPTTEMLMWIALCGLCVIASGVYSAAETGIYCVSRLRLSLAAHRKEPRGLILQNLLQNRSDLLATTLFGTNVANYLAPFCLTLIFLARAEPGLTEAQAAARAEFYTTLILTPVIFIFGEVVPKNLFQRHADTLMPRFATLLAFSRRLFQLTGLIAIQRRLALLFLRRSVAIDPASALGSRLQVYQMLHEGAAEGNLTNTQIAMLESVHKLRGVSVSNVMVPLPQVLMLRADARRDGLDASLRTTRHSRMPVYRNDRSQVTGMVHLLDLFNLRPEGRVEEVLRPVIRIPATTTVLETLSILQRERRRMAVIQSESGRCLGIVTVKDLVEEIVGELTAW